MKQGGGGGVVSLSCIRVCAPLLLLLSERQILESE